MADLLLQKIDKRLGSRSVIDKLDLHVTSGEMVCLLGPSGSGKTTTLRMIGGFVYPDVGQIFIDGENVSRTPPERRPTAMVFQQYALWPNMTVFGNVAFGLQLRKLSRAEVRRKVEAVLELVDLQNFARSYPAQLSGGQQQRVALARSLVLEPKVLLLDEPLSNLDAQLRLKVREEIRAIQQRAGITTVFVTHDQEEALSISDRVAVLSEGRIEQFDTPDRLYREPATTFVAQFIGAMNIWPGRIVNGQAYIASAPPIFCDEPTVSSGEYAMLGVRPEDVLLGDEGVEVTVLRRVLRGHYAELQLLAPFGEIRAFVGCVVEVGSSVRIRFRKVLVYEQEQLRVSGKEGVA